MTKRDVTTRGGSPSIRRAMLVDHFGGADAAEAAVDNHILELGSAIGFFEEIGNDRFRDVFGVIWDRSVDKDIGIVEGCVLPEPTLMNTTFPDPLDSRFFVDIPAKIAKYPDRFRVFYLGFSLFERAWTLRGIKNLMLDGTSGFEAGVFSALVTLSVGLGRMVCGVFPRSAQCFFDCGVGRDRNVAKLGAEDSYRTAECLPDGAFGVAACVSSRLRGTRRNSNSQDDTGRTRLRWFLPQSAWQSEERGMEDRPNADNFTERTAEGRAGLHSLEEAVYFA